jgi:outer membrane PBP1 activator LpoA protein
MQGTAESSTVSICQVKSNVEEIVKAKKKKIKIKVLFLRQSDQEGNKSSIFLYNLSNYLSFSLSFQNVDKGYG